MSSESFCVRVFLTDKDEQPVDDIIYGDGSSLGKTFDQIQQEALKYKGGFTDWEVTICDYCFPSKDSAQQFIKDIQRKFGDKIDLEYMGKEDSSKSTSRVFNKLPDTLPERIGALTPSAFRSLKTRIHIIEPESLILPEKEELSELYRTTYANIQCKTRNLVRSYPVLMRSSYRIGKRILELGDPKKIPAQIVLAREAGWSEHDICYDSLINGVFRKDILDETYNSKSCPEIIYACTHAVLVICDYWGDQFVGWYFYNENLDEPMNYTSYGS
jgi:hypothetical protein